ncbi:MAG: tyrosine-type recombinase/integrase [Acidimicrobiales bacterium]
MTGTMRERSPGHWQLRAFVGRDPMTRRKRQVQRTFHGTKRDAEKALAALVTDVSQGRVDNTRATVGQLLDAWVEHIKPIRHPKTVHEASRSIELRLRPALGHIRLDKLSPADLDRWYGQWLSEGLSTSTVRRLHAVLSAALHTGERWGWIINSPARRASPPTARPREFVIPTPKQLGLLYQEALKRDRVLATAVGLAALTGARRGELCALKWSDVNLSVGRIRIARSISSVGDRLLEGPTKTHAIRDVAIDEFALQLLRDRWDGMREVAKQAQVDLVEDPYVLSRAIDGEKFLDPNSLTSSFSRLCKGMEAQALERARAQGRRKLRTDELWPFRFHDLRHFSVTTLIAAGVDVKTVAERHGHAHVTMTLNRYAHALPERDREAAAILSKALAG